MTLTPAAGPVPSAAAAAHQKNATSSSAHPEHSPFLDFTPVGFIPGCTLGVPAKHAFPFLI